MGPRLSPALPPNTVLPGGYRIGSLLGEGAFARVYRATAPTGEHVAAKVLKRLDAQPQKRFAREVKVTRALPQSPHVVRFVYSGELASGVPFLVMEYVDGYTLAELLRSGHRLEEHQACVMMLQLCESFAGVHQLGLTHGDIKPQNIMLDRVRSRVKLLDFGLVRDAQGLLRLFEEQNMLEGHHFAENLDAGMLMGTPEYMAPEIISDAKLRDFAGAQTDTPADVYGLGVIFYELLSGRRPFPFDPGDGPTTERRARLIRYLDWRYAQCPVPLPLTNVSPSLWSIVQKTLRHDPKRRQRDARELQADIERYLHIGAGVPEDPDVDTTISASFEDIRDLLAHASGVFRSPDPKELDQIEERIALERPTRQSKPPHPRRHRLEWWISGSILAVWGAIMVFLALTGRL